jgi:hypothetical protein
MPSPLEPYPFSGIFPELPAEELRHLAQDIKGRGQILAARRPQSFAGSARCAKASSAQLLTLLLNRPQGNQGVE